MNCDLLQRRLLSLERPDRPPAEVESHLADCATCREWHGRLVRLEQRVRRLPVPASGARAEFLARLRAGEVDNVACSLREQGSPLAERVGHTPAAAEPWVRGQRRERALRKLALATALAAGLALFAVGWWAAQWAPAPGRTDPADLVARLVQHDLELAKDPNRDRRLEVLEAMSDDLRGQAAPLSRARAAEDLRELTRCYRQVVDALPDQARQLPRLPDDERSKLAERLRRAGKEAERLAEGSNKECEGYLRDMAAAARNAADRVGGEALRVPAPAHRPFLLCAGGAPLFAAAAGAAPAADPVERFRKDRDLIGKLVDAGVFLASRPGDPKALERARCCSGVAQQLADAMKAADDGKQGERAAKLGEYLGAWLEKGVASNLTAARSQGKVSEKDLQEVGRATVNLLDQLPQSLQDVPAVQEGRDKVQKALVR